VISAHWETPAGLAATSHPQPPLLFDYYGFPDASYALTWPVPGSPALVDRVKALLQPLGLPVTADAKRGLDHGVFVPLKLA
jgi:aromatic ring-opening dioxygenase catalytic subunit (LigB family)